MHRSASRLPRLLACAAVPVMLVVAGCSSGSDDKKDTATAEPSAPAQPTVEPAKYIDLPEACKALDGKTTGKLVPKAKSKNGTPGNSADISTRGSCSWNGLQDQGVKGSQYRWLDISLMRYDSDQALGSGAARAGKHYADEVTDAKGTEGAASVKTTPSSGIGDQATVVSYTLKKTGADFSYATVVARTENVVITLNYNGAGYAGAKSPSVSDLTADAVSAAKEAVAAVTKAGPGSGSGSASGSDSGSGSASPSGSDSDADSGAGAAPDNSSTKSPAPKESATKAA
ncbi:DUF3558 domain-containing protein [Streptomyces sp. NPDC088725]|uniref:DUF3558 domain-containing protein n=1 Tax=Streptomyces sp. NPDC088725 TaxID=3365873 RepID=UPI0038252560